MPPTTHPPDGVQLAPVPRTYPVRSYVLHLVDQHGWPTVITFFDLTLDQFEQTKQKLRERGYTPVVASATPANPSLAPSPHAGRDGVGGLSGVPVCPVHGEPMKKMEKPDKNGSTHWCTKKTGDGFCKERAKA